jgi:hypothetical protein
MSSALPRTIRARPIAEADVEAVVDLLTRGFAVRSRSYWQRALTKLKLHPAPAGLPKFGHLLECGGVPVGVILLICSAMPGPGGGRVRCNMSSWYVEPEFRIYGPLLISQATKHKDVTYVNVSPAMHTLPIIEAQGFSRYGNGQFVAVPALNPTSSARAVRVIAADAPAGRIDAAEQELLANHTAHGCLSLWCVTPTEAHPFVFMPRRIKRVAPCAQLIYCRDIRDFVRFARPLGRYLTARGRPFVIVDANGPIPGLVGKYFRHDEPKYFKGPDQPQSGDLAYTEAVMFGR